MKKLKLSGMILGAALTTGALAGCAPSSSSCGAGKCGSDMKKMEKKGSCGAGKCGAEKKEDAKKKVEGSCGAGKCG